MAWSVRNPASRCSWNPNKRSLSHKENSRQGCGGGEFHCRTGQGLCCVRSPEREEAHAEVPKEAKDREGQAEITESTHTHTHMLSLLRARARTHTHTHTKARFWLETHRLSCHHGDAHSPPVSPINHTGRRGFLMWKATPLSTHFMPESTLSVMKWDE